MVVQPCRIARCATGSFRSIQPFFFFPRSLFLFFTRTRTLEYARNTLPPLIRETSILLLGPRRYCRIAAMLPIRSSHYSPTRIGIGKADPSIFPCLDAVWTRRWLLWLWLVQRDTKFWKFFLRYSMKFSVL